MKQNTKSGSQQRAYRSAHVGLPVALALLILLVHCLFPDHGAAQPKRPFPQHVDYGGSVILPNHVSRSAMDSTVKAHYQVWRRNYVMSVPGTDPIQKFVVYESGPKTVSEAHGYGMVISAYMGSRKDFDAMFHYFKAHPSSNAPHLMSWKQAMINGRMVDVEGVDSATDGDLDIAYALLLADAQWGSSGKINYKKQALLVMHDILTKEVNPKDWNLLCGDWAYGDDMIHTRPSDFMVDHLLTFADADPAHSSEWMNVFGRINSIVNYQYRFGGSADTGIMPDFMVKSGGHFVPVPRRYLEGKHDGDFDYNACRTPWRLPMAFIVAGRREILPVLTAQDSWIRGATGGVVTRIRAGYYIKNGPNGKPYRTFDDLCFTAPFAVEAMIDPTAQSWLNKLWTSITGGDYGKSTDYYGDSIRMQVLLVVSGNWWLPTGT